MNELKITLQQLLSLYTGGRPVGTRNYNEQNEEFFTNYALLKQIRTVGLDAKQAKVADSINFKNVTTTIEFQYPEIKKIKKLCKEYIKEVPAMYSEEADENILKNEEYIVRTNSLMKAARKVMGKKTKFVVKNLKDIGR